MKEVLKILVAGAGVGAAITQIINMAVFSLMEKNFVIGGEVLLPVMIGLVFYIGWKLSETYFFETRRQKLYQKGFDDGLKIHSYKLFIPEKEGEITAIKDDDAA